MFNPQCPVSLDPKWRARALLDTARWPLKSLEQSSVAGYLSLYSC